MGTLFDLLSYLMFVFGILEIILFFKIWGMTNDVRKMKLSITSGADVMEKKAIKAIVQKDPNLENILFDFAYSALSAAYQKGKGVDATYERAQFNEAIGRIKAVYNKADLKIPEAIDKIKSCKTFDDCFSIPKN